MINEKRMKVLVVEDDPSRRELNCTHLESGGYWVFAANRLNDEDPIWALDTSGDPSVIALLKTHYFHAALIDLSLIEDDPKDRTGFEVIKAISRRQEGTKTVVLTGYGEVEDVREIWKALGAFDFLSKQQYTREKALEKMKAATENGQLAQDAIMRSRFTYAELIKTPSLAEVCARLGCSGEDIRPVVEKGLRQYFPYDRQARKAEFVDSVLQAGTEYPVFLAQVWSRYLGAEVRLRIASREACDYLYRVREDALAAAETKTGHGFERIEIEPRDRWTGLLEEVPRTDFGVFLQRTAEAPSEPE